MSTLRQDQGKRNTAPAGETRRRRLGAWLLLGWAMFWFTTAIAQPFCCKSFAGGTGNEPALAQQLSDHLADHPGDTSQRGPDCPDLAVPNAISPIAAASSADRLDPTVAPPPLDAIKPVDNEPARLARYLSIPPPQHVPLYLRNQRFLI
jgi:hypothetical protein